MNSNWTFKLALCFITLYVVNINCQSSIDDKGDDSDKGQNTNQTWYFYSTKNVTLQNGKNQSQINCENELCKTSNLKSVNCSGNFKNVSFLTINTNYMCVSDLINAKKYNANYTIDCKYRNERDEYLNDDCWVDVSLNKKSSQYDNKSSVGIVIGIIIGLIVIVIAIVALLGWRGIGPMKRIFNS